MYFVYDFGFSDKDYLDDFLSKSKSVAFGKSMGGRRRWWEKEWCSFWRGEDSCFFLGGEWFGGGYEGGVGVPEYIPILSS